MGLSTVERASLRQAVAGGAVVALAMIVSAVTVGLSGVGGGEARDLLRASLPVAERLFATAMIVSSTTLTLMLTMLGMTAEERIDSAFYTQIRRAATVAVAVFAVATVALIVVAIPFREGDHTSGAAYTALYYAISGVGALIGGALVAVMITLHGAIRNLIGLVDDDADAAIVEDGPVAEDA